MLGPALLLSLLAAPASAARVFFGGFGHVTQGFLVGDPSGMSTELEADDGGSPHNALLLGGGGAVIIPGSVVIGGHGYGLETLGGDGVGGSSQASGGGGGFHAGWAPINDGRRLIYPSVGVNFVGVDVLVQNHSEARKIGNFAMTPGDRVVMTGGGVALDFGLNLIQLFWGEEGGGAMIGGRMGYWLPVGEASWETQGGGAVSGVDGAPSGLYFRVDVGGGGGFSKREMRR